MLVVVDEEVRDESLALNSQNSAFLRSKLTLGISTSPLNVAAL